MFLSVARGRGTSRNYLLTRHLLPHAAPPMLTVIGLSAAALLGGAPVVETVFTWPGVGLYVVKAIDTRDLPVVAATALLLCICEYFDTQSEKLGKFICKWLYTLL